MVVRNRPKQIICLGLFAVLLLVAYRTGIFVRSITDNLETVSSWPKPKATCREPKLPNHTWDTEREKVQPNLTLTHGYSLTLTIRMAAMPKLVQRLYCIVLRSVSLFWSPKLGHISLILDEESVTDHKFAARLREQEHSLGVKFDFLYEPLPDDPSFLNNKYKSTGYNRQLWSSFIMDQYINTSIIAWSDTDAMFTTPVTPQNIFNGDRLQVVSRSIWSQGFTRGWDRGTRIAIGKKMVANFAYFPIFIWRDTITNCKNYILKHMKVSSLKDAYQKIYQGQTFLSPVNIFLTYAYYFEHDRYDWHIDVNNKRRVYNKERMTSDIKESEILPVTRVTIHEGYYDRSRPSPIRQGYCFAKRYVDVLPASCKQFENMTNFQLFEFDKWHDHLHTWCMPGKRREDCIKLIDAHYQNVGRYYKMGLYDLNLQKVYAVEKAAAELNVSCPKIF